MADILFRPQCDDDDDGSNNWNPACVTCLYKQIITHIWSNVDKKSRLPLYHNNIRIDNGYEDEIDSTLVTLDYFKMHFLSYIFMI